MIPRSPQDVRNIIPIWHQNHPIVNPKMNSLISLTSLTSLTPLPRPPCTPRPQFQNLVMSELIQKHVWLERYTNPEGSFEFRRWSRDRQRVIDGSYIGCWGPWAPPLCANLKFWFFSNLDPILWFGPCSRTSLSWGLCFCFDLPRIESHGMLESTTPPTMFAGAWLMWCCWGKKGIIWDQFKWLTPLPPTLPRFSEYIAWKSWYARVDHTSNNVCWRLTHVVLLGKKRNNLGSI